MSLYFRSIRSSSSGNCLLIWTADTQIVIDCGFNTQSDCETLLKKYAGRLDDIDAVLITHAHGDHICYSSLRVLSDNGVRIRAHKSVMRQIVQRRKCCDCHDWDDPPFFHAFSEGAFQAGDLRITPIEVPHAPGVPNFGFVICHGKGNKRRKIVICTDFHNYGNVLRHFVNADFIFVESNHDLELLRRYPNEASDYHLSNPKASWLLYHAIRKSACSPQAVMLGHLSRERNRETLALDMVEEVFDRQRKQIDFRLSAAPLYEASKTIRID